MDALIRFIATYFILIPVIGVLYIAFRQHKKKQFLELAFLLGVGGALSLLLAFVGSRLYNNPRPFVVGHFTPLIPHGNDNGFPSDHTLLSAFLGFVGLYYSRKLGIGLLLIAAMIGGARMAAGVHHLSDVLGSFGFAGLSCLMAIWCKDLLFKKAPTMHQEPLKPSP